MLKIAKYVVYVGIAALVIGLFWFMPKYSYVQKNPGYCVNLTEHLYYCGSKANVKEMFEKTLDNEQVQNSAQDAAKEVGSDAFQKAVEQAVEQTQQNQQ